MSIYVDKTIDSRIVLDDDYKKTEYNEHNATLLFEVDKHFLKIKQDSNNQAIRDKFEDIDEELVFPLKNGVQQLKKIVEWLESK